MLEVEPLCAKTAEVEEIMDLVKLQCVSLQKDVKRYIEERGA
jgi:hypothetical protein